MNLNEIRRLSKLGVTFENVTVNGANVQSWLNKPGKAKLRKKRKQERQNKKLGRQQRK